MMLFTFSVCSYAILTFFIALILNIFTIPPLIGATTASLQPLTSLNFSSQKEAFSEVLGTPDNVAVDRSSNKVLIINDDDSIIRWFTNDGEFIKSWGNKGKGNGEFRHPLGIAVDSRGNVFVADTDNSRIQ